MITPITKEAELSEISGGRFSRFRRTSRTGNNVATTVSSASGDEVETGGSVTTSNDISSISGFSRSSSRFSS